MLSRRSVTITLVTVTLSRPNSVRKRSWVSGRGGTRFSRGKAMPVPSAAPMPMAKLRLSRLPWRTIAGCCPLGSTNSPTTRASWGPVAGGVWAGRRAGDVTSIATASSGSAILDARESVAIIVLLARLSAPAVSGPGRSKSTRGDELAGRARAQAEGQGEARDDDQGERAPHDAVTEPVSDVTEHHRAHGIAHQKHRAEDAHRAAPPSLRRHVHEEGGQGGIEEAVGAARQEPREEEEGHHGEVEARSRKEGEGDEEARRARHDEEARHDHLAAPARIDQVAPGHAHAHRRDGVGGVEEADAVHAQAVAEGRQESEHDPGAETEEESQRHVHLHDVGDALAERLEARPGAHVGRPNALGAHDEEGRGGREEHGQGEEPAEAQLAHHELAKERSEGRAEKARDAVDAKGPAAALYGDVVDHVHVVRHEEGGEADALHRTQEGEQREREEHEEADGGEEEEGDAQEHEEAAAHPIEPEADERLADDARRIVHPLHEPDLRLRASQPLDVERQENEAAQARHEHEIGEGRPREWSAGDELELANHGRCGPLSPRRKITGIMTRAAIARAHSSMHTEPERRWTPSRRPSIAP